MTNNECQSKTSCSGGRGNSFVCPGIVLVCSVILVAVSSRTLFAEQPEPLTFRVEPEVAYRELAPTHCWFHPRVAAIPGSGKNGKPAVIMTIQKHLGASDHYSGLWFLRSDDLGKTWAGPTEIPELGWGSEPGGVDIAVCDVTPGWHAPSGKLIALGIKVRYNAKGAQLYDKPGAHEIAYATFDPKTGKWSHWNYLAMPDSDTKFYLVGPGCTQWLVQPDGTVLIPVYYRGPSGDDFSTTIVHASFDGETMKYIEHGDEMELAGGRGLVEPSLAFFDNKYYLTLRNDARGYVTTSDDGLHFAPRKEWTFDDGKELGSYNTQQHWLTHSDGIFLSYTRRGANNDHIMRNRAPLFIAQVDPEKLQVIRATEQVLIPERGAMLGNFGATAITSDESWVTDSEFMIGDKPHERGADGSTWVSRVRWSKPNRPSK